MTNWIETYPSDMPAGEAFVTISDGRCTHCAPGSDLDAMIVDYADSYEFNVAGDDVTCSASLYPDDWDGEKAPESVRDFVIRNPL